MELRRATNQDYDQIVQLQLENLSSNLTPDQQQDGFLSAYFKADELEELNRDIGVLVCTDNGQVVGFLCMSSPELNMKHSLPSTMLQRFAKLEYRGRPLDEWKSIVCGPVCVSREQRGKGIFPSIYRFVPQFVPTEYELATTLIALGNGRSLAAHEKVGFERIDAFTWNNRDYAILVSPLPELGGAT